MKKFWKRTEGFTLVELIVVIAILGILAGIGTVGYSGYVKKANMAADQQLVSDIKNALTLASYSDSENFSAGSVIITRSETKTSPENSVFLQDAMEAAFGSSWQTLKLQYDWSENSDNLLSLVAGQTNAQYVAGSAFLQNSSVPELLNDVKYLTNAATGFLAQRDGALLYSGLNSVLNEGQMEDILEQAGLGDTLITSGASYAFDVANNPDLNTQLSNLMVLTVAQELDALGEAGTATAMQELWLDGRTTADLSPMAELALSYAAIEACVLGANDPALTAKFDQMNANLAAADSLPEVNAALDALLGDDLYGDKADGYAYTDNSYNALTADFINDTKALSAIMDAVSSVSGDYMNAEVLSDSDLYVSGKVANHVNGYVGAASMDVDDLSNLENGAAVVFLSRTGGILNVTALPGTVNADS